MLWFKRLKKYDPEDEENLQNDIERDGGLEKNDTLAMLISSFLVLVLPVIAILGIFVLVLYLLT